VSYKKEQELLKGSDLLSGLLYSPSKGYQEELPLGFCCFDHCALVVGGGWNYVLSLGGWVACGGCSDWVLVAVLIEFRVLLNQEFFAACISFIRAPL
jgi:hypothetical protein